MYAKYKGELEEGSKTLIHKFRFRSKFCHHEEVRNAFIEILDLIKDLVNYKIRISNINQRFLNKE